MKLLLTSALILLLAPQESREDFAKRKAPKGIDAAAFARLDRAHRWVTYRNSVSTDAALIATWIAFLEAQKDFETLESIAIYEGFHALFQKGKPGEILVRHNAPQWMRVALWNLKQADSHSVEAARSPLEESPDRFMGWAKKYPAVKRLGGAKLMKTHAAVQPFDPGNQLPPLDPQMVILPFLDAPRRLPVLTADTTFQKTQRYRFQVLRAIKAISVAATFGEPYRGKLLRLTRHADAEVRRAAMLEFTEFPAAQVPFAELLSMARNETPEDADRQAALLAASYSRHPEVYLVLHELLQKPKHPGFHALVQRMYALSDGYTLQILRSLPRKALPESTRSLVAQLEKVQRQAENQRRNSRSGAAASVLLHRAAWAVQRKSPQKDALLKWTRAHVQHRLTDAKFRKALAGVPGSLPGSSIPKSLHAWIEAETARLLRGG